MQIKVVLRSLFPIILFLAIVAPVAADGGPPVGVQTPQITYMMAETITLPYEFEPIDFSSSSAQELNIDLTDTTFISQIGSIALTLFSLLDDLAILGIFTVLLLGVAILFWLWRIVTDEPSQVTLNMSGTADMAADIYDAQPDADQNRRRQANEFRKAARSIRRARRF